MFEFLYNNLKNVCKVTAKTRKSKVKIEKNINILAKFGGFLCYFRNIA